MKHIKSFLRPTLDLLQFANRAKCSTHYAISSLLHRLLPTPHSPGAKVFIRENAVHRLKFSTWWHFHPPVPSCWAKGPLNSVLSHLRFTPLTQDCTSQFRINHLNKFADNTTNETDYNREVSPLVRCYKDNNLLTMEKMKEMVIDFSRGPTWHPSLTIDGSTLLRLSTIKFMGVHIIDDLSWSINITSLAKRPSNVSTSSASKKVSSPVPLLLRLLQKPISPLHSELCLACSCIYWRKLFSLVCGKSK